MSAAHPLACHARIAVNDPADCLVRLCDHFEELGVEVQREAHRCTLRLLYGTAVLTPLSGQMLMEVTARDETGLLNMKSGLAGNLESIAPEALSGLVWQGDAQAGRMPPNFRELQVLDSWQVTPRMKRLRFAGEDLARFAGEDLHVRLLIPPADSRPQWPRIGPDGQLAWPEGAARPHARAYTLRRIDPRAGWLDVDFVLHEGAGEMPGSDFARQAQPGDRLGMTGPGGGGAKPAAWYLLAGDETALPAIARMLEELPREATGRVLLEVADSGEQQLLKRPPGMRLEWLNRAGRPAGTTDLLGDAIRQVDLPSSGSGLFCWLGAERETVREVRDYWRKDLGLERNEQRAVAYWQHHGGKA